MKRALLVIALICPGLVGTAWAGFEAGLQAYYRLDYASAVEEWRPLAENGHATAQYQLGILYYRGEGVVQDDRKAAIWFEKAAEAGDADAQFNLALMYLHGRGVPQNFVRAHMWFSLAAWRYSNAARQDWAIRNTRWAARNRDWVLAQLSPKQIAEARRLVKNWKANH